MSQIATVMSAGSSSTAKPSKVKKGIAIVLASLALLVTSAQAAQAYGSGTWNYAPPTCNEGSKYSGSSSYNFTSSNITAQTSESGNFCFAPSKYDVYVAARYSNNTQSSTVAGRDLVRIAVQSSYSGLQGGGHGWDRAWNRT